MTVSVRHCFRANIKTCLEAYNVKVTHILTEASGEILHQSLQKNSVAQCNYMCLISYRIVALYSTAVWSEVRIFSPWGFPRTISPDYDYINAKDINLGLGLGLGMELVSVSCLISGIGEVRWGRGNLGVS